MRESSGELARRKPRGSGFRRRGGDAREKSRFAVHLFCVTLALASLEPSQYSRINYQQCLLKVETLRKRLDALRRKRMRTRRRKLPLLPRCACDLKIERRHCATIFWGTKHSVRNELKPRIGERERKAVKLKRKRRQRKLPMQLERQRTPDF